jgi:uncharacterized protein
MRFPIDAVFLDHELKVLRVVPHLRPWRAAARRGAYAVLELPAGATTDAGLEPGNVLVMSPGLKREAAPTDPRR